VVFWKFWWIPLVWFSCLVQKPGLKSGLT